MSKGVLHVIAVDGTVKETRIETTKGPTLEQLQEAVGGLIQPVKILFMGRKRTAYVNEEGLLHGLQFNPKATQMWKSTYPYATSLVGPLVVFVPDKKGV